MAEDKNFIAETTFHVRYAETDAMGIVHHASYVVYFEEGRSHLIRQLGTSYADFERSGYYLAVSEVNIRYLKPARYDQRITVRCWVESFKSRSMVFAYEILDASNQERLVTGTSKHICINQEGHFSKIPDEWREWFK